MDTSEYKRDSSTYGVMLCRSWHKLLGGNDSVLNHLHYQIRRPPICSTFNSALMASTIFKRAGWCLEITRSSRNFSVSISTALRQQNRHRRSLRDGIAPPATTSSIRDSIISRTHRQPRGAYARSIASTARKHQASTAEEVERATTAVRPPPITHLRR